MNSCDIIWTKLKLIYAPYYSNTVRAQNSEIEINFVVVHNWDEEVYGLMLIQ